MALRQSSGVKVIGIGRNISRLARAKKLGAADEITTDYCAGVKQADLVVIAVPVEKTFEVIKKIRKCLKSGAVVTDAGSVKRKVVELSEKMMPPGVRFVGSHPMAGSEKSGVANAAPGLFRGATCIVTVTRKTDPSALRKVSEMWKNTGARILVKTPEEHDRITAEISHLPHLLSFALMERVAEANKKYGDADRLAAGAYRDMTRIAASSPEVWADIFTSNAEFINTAAAGCIEKIEKLRKLIKAGNRNKIIAELERTGKAKARLDADILRKKGN